MKIIVIVFLVFCYKVRKVEMICYLVVGCRFESVRFRVILIEVLVLVFVLVVCFELGIDFFRVIFCNGE